MKKLLIALAVVGVLLFAYSTLQPNSKSIDTKERTTRKMDNSSFLQSMLPQGYVGSTGTFQTPTQQLINNPVPATTSSGGGGGGTTDYSGQYYPSTTVNTGSYSGGGGATYSAPAPDPYAKWGGQTQYNNLVSGFNDQKQNIYGTANDAAANQGISLKNNILDFVQGLRTGQRGIDQQAVNNDLAKRQGVSGILGMVGRGIRSSGVTLANKNAADSSAAGAIANAYGQYGRGQMANVGNQFAQGENAVNLAQANLGDQQAAGTRRLSDSKTQVVNGIVADARDKFAQLDASMVNASMPDRIAIEQEKENVRQQVLGQLQQYDQLLSNETSSIAPTSQDARMTEAARLQNAGTDLGTNAFQYSTQTPTQFQNTGPFASELPLFTYRGNKQTA